MVERVRVTYATLSADNEDLHTAYEEGVRVANGWCGEDVRPYLAGEQCAGGAAVGVYGPNDASKRLCTVHPATDADVERAVEAARRAAPAWAATGWRERVAVLRRCADAISDRSSELAALMSMEVGKNRLEALGDVEETADLIRYYCDQFEAQDGFDRPMATIAPAERTRSVLRPYGVWAVISPFNYPAALAGGPLGAALVAGNTVVLKSSLQGSFVGWKLFACLLSAGLPDGVLGFLPGGDEPGAALVGHPGVDGLTFTGSYQTGMGILRRFGGAWPKPAVCEMGGKNAAIVTARADLDRAVPGVLRSAFGFSGQKCSACSRVYVAREVHDEFVARLAAGADALVVGNATDRDTFVGPVIDAGAVERYERVVAHARDVGRVVTGGRLLRDGGLAHGHFVAPTVVADAPVGDDLFVEEYFLPVVAVAAVDDLDEALARVNASPLGLTAGMFSADEREVATFLERVEAGVVYVNRPAGATTGAWPGVQPFGGWKGSGSSGKAGGGPYYVQQFLREQSQTVVI